MLVLFPVYYFVCSLYIRNKFCLLGAVYRERQSEQGSLILFSPREIFLEDNACSDKRPFTVLENEE